MRLHYHTHVFIGEARRAVRRLAGGASHRNGPENGICPGRGKGLLWAGGFSLVELLVVISVMAIVMSMVVPTVNSVMDANKVSVCGQIINDQIALARQLAATRGRGVELRIYQPDGSRYSALQIVDANDPSGKIVSLTKPVVFPDGYVLYPDWSPLITTLSTGTTYTIKSGQAQIGGLSDVKGVRLLIRACGVVEPTLSSTNNYVTVANFRKVPPVNYATVQIDPISARSTIYRP